MSIFINGVDQGLAITTSSDHDVGLWTPSIADDGLDGTGEGQTYSLAAGFYTKVGNIIHIQGVITITSLGTLTAEERINIMGLPFVSENTANKFGNVYSSSGSSLAVTATANGTGYITPNTSYITWWLWDNVGGSANFTVTELSAGGTLYFAGVYTI